MADALATRSGITRKLRIAFSLIEMLIVIAILSILASILLINMAEAQTRAKVARARGDMRSLMTALASYRMDYEDFPPSNAVPPTPPGPTILSEPPGMDPPAKTPDGYYDGYPAVPRHLTTPIAYITVPHEVFRKNDILYSNSYGFRLVDHQEQLESYSYFRIISDVKWWDDYRKGYLVPVMSVNEDPDGVWWEPPDDEFFYHFNVGAFSKYGEWLMIGAGPDHTFTDWAKDLTFNDQLFWVYPAYNYDAPTSLLLRRPTTPPWGYSFDVPYDPTNGTNSFGNLILTQLGNNQPATRWQDEDSETSSTLNPYTGNQTNNYETTGTSNRRGLAPLPPKDPAAKRNPRRGEPGAKQSTGISSPTDPKITQVIVMPRKRGNAKAIESSRATEVATVLIPEKTATPEATSTTTPISNPIVVANVSTKVREAAAEKALHLDPPPSTLGPVRSFAWLLLILALLLLLWALERWWNREDSALKQARVKIGAGKMAAHEELLELEELDLSHSDISDDGMRILSGLPRLESLSLWDTSITDVGLDGLYDLQNLRTLNLSETQVTDAGMKNLERFPALHTLILAETAVGDAAIADLLQLTRLHNLALRGTRITPEGLAQLREALPRCAITHFLDDAIRPLAPAQ